MIDTHAHLFLSKTSPELLLKRASDAGVTHIIHVATDVPSSKTVLAQADQFPQTSPTVGLHPLSIEDQKDQLSEIEGLLESTNAWCALGEIGLDYKYTDNNKDQQIEVFEQQLRWAKQYGLPSIIHSRQADEDVIKILNRHEDVPVVVHCFSSGPNVVDALSRPTIWFSFTGMITYSHRGKVLDALKKIPMSRIMIETDSPYLVPKAHKGVENEPAFVVEIAKKIAEVKNMSLEEVLSITTENAISFFGLST